MKTLYGIYVPGLGDSNRPREARLSGFWRAVHHIDLQYHPVLWDKGNDFQSKLNKLVAHIDRLYEQHGKVALVGTSAGASAVLNAYAQRPDMVRAVVIICGKVQNPGGIGPSYRRNFPAFIQSMDMVQDSLQSLSPAHRQRILSRIPLIDELVPLKDMRISGAQHDRQYTVFHAPSIAIGMTTASRPAARFIRAQSD